MGQLDDMLTEIARLEYEAAQLQRKRKKLQIDYIRQCYGLSNGAVFGTTDGKVYRSTGLIRPRTLSAFEVEAHRLRKNGQPYKVSSRVDSSLINFKESHVYRPGSGAAAALR